MSMVPGASLPTYSMGSTPPYVMIPDQNVDAAKQQIADTQAVALDKYVDLRTTAIVRHHICRLKQRFLST